MRAVFFWLSTCLALTAGEHRIASYSPGATQTLLDLGCSAEIVMATRWCPLPKEHPAVRDADVFLPDLEKLLTTKPDLVIIPRMANPLWAEKCAKAGLRTIILNPESRNSCSNDILLIGEAIGRADEAKRVADLLKRRPAKLSRKIIIVWDGVMAGPDSYVAEPLAVAALQSALPRGAWVKFDWELVATANPDAILWIQNSPANGPVQVNSEKIAEMSRISVIKDLACVKKTQIYLSNSGSNWLPGSGLTKVQSGLKEIRDGLGQ